MCFRKEARCSLLLVVFYPRSIAYCTLFCGKRAHVANICLIAAAGSAKKSVTQTKITRPMATEEPQPALYICRIRNRDHETISFSPDVQSSALVRQCSCAIWTLGQDDFRKRCRILGLIQLAASVRHADTFAVSHFCTRLTLISFPFPSCGEKNRSD